MSERIQIVDEADNPLGFATREEAWEQGLYRRFVRIVLFDEHGRVLLQRRSALKKQYPDMWTDAATGHVDYGETYEVAAAREISEELGVGADLTFVGKFFTEDQDEDQINRVFHGVFRGTIASDAVLSLQESEVSSVRWFEPDELRSEVAEHPEQFTPGVRGVVARYL